MRIKSAPRGVKWGWNRFRLSGLKESFHRERVCFHPYAFPLHVFLLTSLPTTLLSCVTFGDVLLDLVAQFSELLVFMRHWLNSLGTIKLHSIPEQGASVTGNTSGWTVKNTAARKRGGLLGIQIMRGRPCNKSWQRRKGLLSHLCTEPGIPGPWAPWDKAEGHVSNRCLSVGQGPSLRAMGLWRTNSPLGLLRAVQATCIFIQRVRCTSASQVGAEITRKPVTLPASPPYSFITALLTSVLSLLTASLGPLAAVLRPFFSKAGNTALHQQLPVRPFGQLPFQLACFLATGVL